MNRVILWLRNDLRMHDNYVLNWATQLSMKSGQTKQIIPVYCFDPRIYSKEESQTKYETRKIGLIRAKFHLEAVSELRQSLSAIGSNLIVSSEIPETFIPKLLVDDKDTHNIIVYQSEICSEELTVESNLKMAVEKMAGKGKKFSA